MNVTLVKNSLIAATCIGALAACTAPAPQPVQSATPTAESSAQTATPEASASSTSTAAGGDAGLSPETGPYTVMSCTEELTFEKAPERIVMLYDIAVPFLSELGKMDRIVAMSQAPTPGIYDDEVYAQLENVPLLDGTKTEGGGVNVSLEKILEVHPDLVIGTTNAADSEALKKSGINMYVPDQYCSELERKPASFEDAKKESLKFAKIMNDPEAGQQLVDRLDQKIKAVRDKAPSERVSAAGIYIDEGTEEFWGYGNASMVQPIFDAVGFDNVYGDNPERLIEGMSMETVLEKNPNTIVLFFIRGTPETVKQTFASLPAADQLDAVKNDRVYAMPFRLTDPPSPVSVRGVEKLSELLGS